MWSEAKLLVLFSSPDTLRYRFTIRDLLSPFVDLLKKSFFLLFVFFAACSACSVVIFILFCFFFCFYFFLRGLRVQSLSRFFGVVNYFFFVFLLFIKFSSVLFSSPDMLRIGISSLRSSTCFIYFFFCFSLRPEFILNPSKARGLGPSEFTPFFRGGAIFYFFIFLCFRSLPRIHFGGVEKRFKYP